MASYTLKKSSNGKFRFNLVADNHQTVLTSETYNQREGALNGIESIKKNSAKDERYQRKVSKRGLHFFVLKATNGEIIGTSEEYSSKSAMEDGIAAVKRIGPKAKLKDETV
jgi:uncharacterized protein YegP (UPF0339 family)